MADHLHLPPFFLLMTEWVLCRLTGLGMLQELLKSEDKPSRDDIADALNSEEKKPGNELLKKITNFVDLGGS